MSTLAQHSPTTSPPPPLALASFERELVSRLLQNCGIAPRPLSVIVAALDVGVDPDRAALIAALVERQAAGRA